MNDLGGAQRIALDLADQCLDRRAAVDGHVEDRGARADPEQRLVERGLVDRDGLGLAAVPVDDARDLAVPPERAGRALAGGGAGGRLETRLLCHGPILRVERQ